MNRRDGLRFGAGALLLALAAGVRGQGAPVVPPGSLKIVVPDARGSATDAIGRAFAPALAAIQNRPVALVNRPGGIESVAKAPPDGSTALLATGTLAMNAALQPAFASDVVRLLSPVALVATAPYVLAAATTLPLDSVQDVIAIAKANPGRLRYAATARGGPGHLAAEMLKSLATVQLTQALYPDTAAALADLAAGKAQLWFGRYDEVQALAKSGKVRVIAVSGPRRPAHLPDVPTMAEAGVPGFDVVQWFGLFVPATTPKATVERLQADVRRALQAPEVRDRLSAQLAVDVVAGSSDALDALLKRDIAAWTKLARDMNLKVE